MKDLSVIIPARNVEKTLEKLHKLVIKELGNVEVIICEDGSSDSTKTIAKKLSKKYKKTKLISKKQRQGKGGALISGFNKASNNKIVFIDADLSIHPREIKKINKMLGKYDVVFGSRRIKGSKVKVDQCFSRRFAGIVYRLLVNLLLGVKAKDTQCGLKGFKKKVYNKIKPLRTTGWGFDVEILAKAKKHGFSLKEVPITWKESESTRLNILKDSVAMFFELLKIRNNLRKDP